MYDNANLSMHMVIVPHLFSVSQFITHMKTL